MTIWWDPSEKMPKKGEWVAVQWIRNDGKYTDEPIGFARYMDKYGWVPINKGYHVWLWAERE